MHKIKISSFQGTDYIYILRKNTDVATILIPGLGMDCESYIDILLQAYGEHIGLGYNNSNLYALTLPGFGKKHTNNEYSMESQKNYIIEFCENLAKNCNIRNFSLYGFSYGADLLLEVNQAFQKSNILKGKRQLSIFCDPNVGNSDSLFITKPICDNAPDDNTQINPSAIFKVLMNDIIKMWGTEFGNENSYNIYYILRYLAILSQKDINQLSLIAKEVIDNDAVANRLKSFISNKYSTDNSYFIFSNINCHKVFNALVKSTNNKIHIDSVCTGDNHFAHIEPSGFVNNYIWHSDRTKPYPKVNR